MESPTLLDRKGFCAAERTLFEYILLTAIIIVANKAEPARTGEIRDFFVLILGLNFGPKCGCFECGCLRSVQLFKNFCKQSSSEQFRLHSLSRHNTRAAGDPENIMSEPEASLSNIQKHVSLLTCEP